MEATRNDFIGLEGKFGCILKNLGTPILTSSNYGGMIESNEFEDVWQIGMEEEKYLPEADMDEGVDIIGYLFSGLSNGINLEMTYMLESKKLTVYYKSLLVYLEEENDLKSYIPFDEWEKKVEGLYKIAKVREKKKRIDLVKEEENEIKAMKKHFLKEMFRKWGF